MNVVIQILRYTKAPPRKGVLLEKNTVYKDVMIYNDANWTLDNRISTFVYFIFVKGNLVTWLSK